MFMRRFGRLIRRMKIGRWLDWFWFNLARLRSPGKITADGIPFIDWPFRLDVQRGSTMHIGTGVMFRSGFHCKVAVGGHLEIGDRVMFNTQAWIGVIDRVSVGRETLFGPRIVIVDSDHRFDDLDVPTWKQGTNAVPVEIGSNVWIGAHTTVTKSIGDDCVIGANAVVTKAIPPRSVAMGVPARVVRSRETAEETGF